MGNQRRTSMGCIALVMLAVGLADAGAAAPAVRPNIVCIVLDNVGQEWFGCYGSLEGRTPQIDRLAQSGVRFEHCYASPICSVSRVTLLTGRYPFRTGWTFHHDAGIYGGGKFDWRRERTFARVLRDAGYATCVAGKWQINNFNEAGQENCLREHGFDEHLITPGGKEDSKYWDPLLIRNGVREVRNGEYAPDLFTEFIVDFLRRHRDRPQLVYYPITLVHAPYTATPGHRDRALPPAQLFGESLGYADRLVGQIVKALDELGLRDRTMVFVTSDNGNEGNVPARTRAGVVRGRPYTFAEVSIDMPLVVNCPGRVPAGRVGGMADYTDFLPTFVDLCDVKPPDEVKLDGQSFAGWLLGRQRQTPRLWIHSAFQDVRVVRDERYKLYSSGALFDLQSDPDETRKLGDGQAAEARERLGAVLKSFPADAPQGFEPQSVTARKFRAEQQRKAAQSPPK